MSNKRLNQLSVAYANITGVSLQDAKKTILRTPTGKAVASGNKAVLYEQHTANLYGIMSELGPAVRAEISTEVIRIAVSKAVQPSQTVKRKYSAAKPCQKRMMRQKLLRLQKEQINEMKLNSKNLINLGRVFNAD